MLVAIVEPKRVALSLGRVVVDLTAEQRERRKPAVRMRSATLLYGGPLNGG